MDHYTDFLDDEAKWVIVDIDGTLFNGSHRTSLLPDWEAFHAAHLEDVPFPNVVEVVRHFSAVYGVLLITGRTDTYKGSTIAQLEGRNIPYDALLMRPALDYTPDVEMKWDLACQFFGGEATLLRRVLVVLEDRDKVVEMWRNKGLTCFQVRLGEY